MMSLVPESISSTATPRSHVAFGLTPRALLLLVSGTLWLVPAFFWPHFAWGLVAWDAAVLVLTVFDALQLPAPRLLRAGRSWGSAPSLEHPVEVKVSLLQTGARILACTAMDDLPAALSENAQELKFEAFPNAPASARYSFTPNTRGDHETGKLYVRYRSSIGMIERWAAADLRQRVRVYPSMRSGEEQSLFLARSRQIELQARLQRQRGLGRDFESLREYREGDDVRDICWTASARHTSLVTRQYQTERSQPVWIVLDAGRLLRTRIGQYSKLDYGTSTALALAQLALFSGDRVGILAYGQTVQQRVGLGRGASHLRSILDALALVRPEAAEADHLRATATLIRMQPRRSLILWLTDLAETAMRPEVIDGASQLMRRHVLLFVAISQPDVQKLAEARPQNAEDMYRSAAAQELVQRREVLLARLRERGALTLETSPDATTSAVLNRYLEVKEHGLI